ncbi:MAG: hypothetical protein P4L40_25900 [Terracidiphilus sp.]|nr:hypothetical protein [Terracidiphilus sp.]
MCARPSLVSGYSKAILTPNVAEAARLWAAAATLPPAEGASAPFPAEQPKDPVETAIWLSRA